ncbi:hypothetical protein RISK_002138 [Rhodopirellula islandica]|uniref:Uncharacterized protein n=1 Tax=Rhodopirellula islandica TaxID=595434 RepID=A0A0J1BG53_RHOIS|nr:hypothetical protein RISK_002138 [Rhodopirellula islandica]
MGRPRKSNESKALVALRSLVYQRIISVLLPTGCQPIH